MGALYIWGFFGAFSGAKWGYFFHFLFFRHKQKTPQSERFSYLNGLFPIKDNFTGSTATHSVEAFLEIINLVVVSDDW